MLAKAQIDKNLVALLPAVTLLTPLQVQEE